LSEILRYNHKHLLHRWISNCSSWKWSTHDQPSRNLWPFLPRLGGRKAPKGHQKSQEVAKEKRERKAQKRWRAWTT